MIPVAKAPTGTAFHQAMYVPAGGLPVTGGADPRTTMRYDRARTSPGLHATYIVAAYIAGATR